MKNHVALVVAAVLFAVPTPVRSEPPAHGDSHKPAAKPAPKAEPKPATIRNVTKPDAKPDDKHDAKHEAKPGAGDGGGADEALKMLREGNERWVKGTPSDPAIEPSRRADLAANGQKPFVTILTCADSRLPVERVFDRGVGELFVIRVAGNIAGDSEKGTIEYGLGHLKTPLLVVMGHTKCGAVAAAATNAEVHGHIAGLIERISPAVERAAKANPSLDANELAAVAVKENVWQTVFDLLKHSDETREMVASGEVRVVGAVCDVATGKVDFLGEHPWQGELLAALKAAKTATASADEGGH
jgi:carbonic anhydrase